MGLAQAKLLIEAPVNGGRNYNGCLLYTSQWDFLRLHSGKKQDISWENGTTCNGFKSRLPRFQHIPILQFQSQNWMSSGFRNCLDSIPSGHRRGDINPRGRTWNLCRYFWEWRKALLYLAKLFWIVRYIEMGGFF